MVDLTQSHDVIGAYQDNDYSAIRSKYKDAAVQYAFDVLDEKQIAGYHIRLACFRFLQDLKRQDDPDFPFVYNNDKASWINNFAALCPEATSGNPMKLMNWQKFTFAQMNGWERKSTHTRRFVKTVYSIARDQGKTYLMAIQICYDFIFVAADKYNQEILASANNFDQSMKLFGYVKIMLRKLITIPEFKEWADEVGLKIQSRTIIQTKYNNKIIPISQESGRFDSHHFVLAVADEIGELKNFEGISKITSGQSKVPDHMLVEISTCYQDPTVPFHAEQDGLIEVMEKDDERELDDQLCLLWQQDSTEEIYPEEVSDLGYRCWEKSNPLLGLPEVHDVALSGLISGRDDAVFNNKAADYQAKSMNIWSQSSDKSFLKLPEINNAVSNKPFDIHGRRVYVGMDFSLSSDNTSLAFVYPFETDDGQQKWYITQHSFIPWHAAGSIEAKEKIDGIEYRKLAPEFCTITSDIKGTINKDQVYSWLLNFIQENDLQVEFFGYDAMGVDKVIQLLEDNAKFPLVPVSQRTQFLKDPTKFIQDAFIHEQIVMPNDEVLIKALSNAVIYEDKVGIQVDKNAGTLKIDVDDALVNAFYSAMFAFDDFDAKGVAKKTIVDRMSVQDLRKFIDDPDNGFF
ncbi:terminase large subunit [Fructilactobacillus hinvesii]|uniref:Terminase large subunit n=1 Tax=Fructilactobacillus hinvesii TaxID=2940300 RepID=A0ABY5BQT9_9LACO|nr:terminase TerL endonuclease subunit [Fructilactobacillus hinvesii]USS87473.1 terminase large subunit [Fructilactobacillus hinvesii]